MSEVALDIEERRLALQAGLDEKRTQAERNRLGQFATPAPLARDIVASCIALIPAGEQVHFLDPAIGTGSFYSALRASVPSDRIDTAVGYEIDSHYARPASDLWSGTPLHLVHGDFTQAVPEGFQANLIICNPPYVRHHHMSRDDKARLRRLCESVCGLQVGGLASLYTYFIALAHMWMADGGIAAWLVPSGFMDVNYGNALKQYLLSNVELLRIHQFDAADVQFDDALVSSAIVWFRKAKPPKQHEVEFTYGGRLINPRRCRKVLATNLTSHEKWTFRPVPDMPAVDSAPKLADFFRIQRGLATGDNKFFIMTPSEASARGIPEQFLVPILPGPRWMADDEIMADGDGMPLIARPRVLLDCRIPEAEVKIRYRRLWSYLQSGVPAVSGRYLCAHRSPWYCQERRPAPLFVCTYMGRGDTDGTPPFRFILNHSRATAANVYLLLYPKPILSAAFDRDPALVRQVWGILRTIRRDDLVTAGRVYGGGLHKLEPKELANIPAQAIADLIGVGQLDPLGHPVAAE